MPGEEEKKMLFFGFPDERGKNCAGKNLGLVPEKFEIQSDRNSYRFFMFIQSTAIILTNAQFQTTCQIHLPETQNTSELTHIV